MARDQAFNPSRLSRDKDLKAASANGEKFVYFIQAAHGGPIKIGSARNPHDRLSAIQTASPYDLWITGLLLGGEEEERRLHRALADQRIRGEWFNPVPDLAYLARAQERNPKTVAERIAFEDGYRSGILFCERSTGEVLRKALDRIDELECEAFQLKCELEEERVAQRSLF